jgi:hypothetical protein
MVTTTLYAAVGWWLFVIDDEIVQIACELILSVNNQLTNSRRRKTLDENVYK